MDEGGFLKSVNDTTILAALSRFPGMPTGEADDLIARIENEQNKPICLAVIGRLDKEELEPDARQTFDEFQRWSVDRTRRTRNEQWTARRSRKETRLALKLNSMYERGMIPHEALLMYGISGDMPDYPAYREMSPEEKEAIWAERMEDRFGPNWREQMDTPDSPLPRFLRERGGISVREYRDLTESDFLSKPNWKRDGF